MRVLDLFSGIGGFSLGLERAGMRTVAFCEIDPYCRQVLRKHWPDVPIFDDVRKLNRIQLVWRLVDRPDIICGGFPCQDISAAGRGAGIDGERSGLWREYARLIGDLRPSYAIVENVAALTFRGLLRVLGDLAEIGYDAEWHCISASAVGAPHRRERIWIVAYPASEGRARVLRDFSPLGLSTPEEWSANALDTSRTFDSWTRSEGLGEPPFFGADDGIPGRVDRLRACGNAVVPQIPEIIGRAIMQVERREYVNGESQ